MRSKYIFLQHSVKVRTTHLELLTKLHASIKLSLYKNTNTLKLTCENSCLHFFLYKLFVYFILIHAHNVFPGKKNAHILHTQTLIILTNFLIACIYCDIGGGPEQAIIF